MRSSGRFAVAIVALVPLLGTACAGASAPDESPATAARSAPILCMPRPAACGFPDVSNTGVKPSVPRQDVNGNVKLSTAGAVFQNATLHGTIIVTAPNVTIRNVQIFSNSDYPIRSIGSEGNTGGLLVEDVEVNMLGELNSVAIAFDHYTLRRAFIHNGADCAHLGSDVTIEDTLCVDGPDTNNDGWPDSDSFCNGPEHFDGFQSDGGHDLTIRHNTIRNPCAQTSAILMSTNGGHIESVVIDDNLMAGGGYTVYCGTDSGGIVPNETYTNNIISRQYFPKGGYYGPTVKCDQVARSSGNTWDGTRTFPSTGSPPPPGSTGGGGAGVGHIRLARAKHVATTSLARRLGRRFTRGRRGLHAHCTRRTAAVVGCRVKWHKSRHGTTTWRYSAGVAVTRLSATRWRYALRVRAVGHACGCTRVIKRHGTVRKRQLI